jgi:hypothetical protein
MTAVVNNDTERAALINSICKEKRIGLVSYANMRGQVTIKT